MPMEFKRIKNRGWCRECHKWQESGTEILGIQSTNGTTVLCLDCADKLGQLILKRDLKLDKQL